MVAGPRLAAATLRTHSGHGQARFTGGRITASMDEVLADRRLMADNEEAARRIDDQVYAAPDPHAPVVGGTDILKAVTERALRDVTVRWFEDTGWAHLGGGEVHCTTNAWREVGRLPGPYARERNRALTTPTRRAHAGVARSRIRG
jgi:protein-arginine deiminase